MTDWPTLCWAGHYRRDYPRNVVLQRAAEAGGFRVVDGWGRSGPASAVRAWRLVRHHRADAVVVGFPGYRTLPAVWVAARLARVPLVFDAFVGLHETRVVERRETGLKTIRSGALRAAERLAWRLSDLVLMDTPQHAAWLESQGAKRVTWVALGPDLEAMAACPDEGPAPQADLVAGYGNFAPLHGGPVIAEAARALARAGNETRIVLAGDGPELARTRSLAEGTRLELPGRLPLADIRTLLCSAPVALGIFGTSDKAGRVIPNKVLDALALGRVVITRDGPAARDLLAGAPPAVVLVPPGDGGGLAGAITVLLDRSPAELGRLGAEGRRFVVERFGPGALGARLREVLQEVHIGSR